MDNKRKYKKCQDCGEEYRVSVRVTGKSNANNDAMITAMRAKGYHPGDDNDADALAILHWALV
ncbi:MAG: hypothetical protein HQL07_00530 [Nitrospirae bacterium]|nr:hypothetical protein [Magnetococcales bacterium]